MQAPALHPKEAARLRALRELRILDTPPEARFDRLARLAARLFGVPTALVSLVDEHRQWFKARVGLGASETARESSFCAHAVAADELLLVPDAHSDPRFQDNPLVTGDPRIRFYAGQPLRSPEGLAVGTLCLIDSRPRELTADQASLLRDLADLVEQELWHEELRTLEAQRRDIEAALEASERRHRTMIESLHEGVVLQEAEAGILACNPSAAKILGLSEAQLLGRNSLDPGWRAIHEDGSPWPGQTHPAMIALETGEAQRDQIMGVRQPGGAMTWVQVNADLLRPGLVLVSFSDITKQREASERFRVIFEQSADAHLLFDGSGIIDCNAAAVAMLRCPDKARVLALHPSALSPEFQPDGSRSDTPTTWREDQARAKGSCRFEWMHRTSDGQDFLTEVSLTPVVLNGKEAFLEVWHDLTERKQQENALRASEQRTRFLLEHTTDLIARHDVQGRFTFVTPSVEALLGYRPEELLGRLPTEFQDAADQDGLRRAYGVLLRGESLSSFRFPVRHKTGRRVWLESQANPVLAPETGRVQEVVITSRDVTERVESEEALKASESRFRTMVESLHEAVFMVRGDGRVLAPNLRAQDLLGIRAEDMDALTVRSLDVETFHEDGSPCPPEERPSAQALRTGQPQRQVVLGLRRRDGQRFWVLVNAEPIHGSREEEVIVSFSDITALRESEARNRAMLEAIPDELFRQDRRGVYLGIHSKDPALPFWSPESMLGQGMEELLGAEVAAQRLEAIARALDTGRVQLLEYSLRHGGQERDFEARVVPYTTDETITIVRDITARNMADRLKREFVSTVSHELRTPLTAIRGALGMLEAQQGQWPPQARELLDIALRNGQRLLSLVNDILDLDKVEQGTLDFHLEPRPLRPLVEQAIEALRPYVHTLGCEFSFSPASDGEVCIDGARMLQVLTNLLGNAAKFSPAGQAVQVRLGRRAGQVRVEVENGGPGIPVEFRPRIFQKFAQADSSDARRYPGTGLGLAISKALVERMGGQIEFESGPGRTVFSVAFPLQEPS